MAAKRKPQAAPSDDYLQLLDKLIKHYFERLLEYKEEKPKVGDFLKMIELRHSVTPQGADQGRFWRELEKIRKAALPDERRTGAIPPKDAPPADVKEK